MTLSNVFVGYTGPTSGCTTSSAGSPCLANEVIPFSARSFGYSFTCANHSFTWNYGDNTPAGSGQDAAHAYAASGTYNLVLTISNSSQTITVPQTVRVGGGGGGGTGCPTMVAGSNVFIGYLGPQSGCTSAGGSCKSAENISFSTSVFGYNLSCASHTFQWSFGDEGTSSEQNPVHAYETGGTYTVRLTVGNSAQSITTERTITVTGSNNCPLMVAGQNVHLQFLGQTSHCTAAGGTCQDDEEIFFAVNAVGYNFSCATHTYEWDFGDGTPVSTQQSPSHVYANRGTYRVKVKITNSKQQITLERDISMPTKGRSVRH